MNADADPYPVPHRLVGAVWFGGSAALIFPSRGDFYLTRRLLVEVEGGDPSFLKYPVYGQCCGSGTVSGTATFYLSGTATVMHSGSGSGTGFIPRSNIQKSKNKIL